MEYYTEQHDNTTTWRCDAIDTLHAKVHPSISHRLVMLLIILINVTVNAGANAGANANTTLPLSCVPITIFILILIVYAERWRFARAASYETTNRKVYHNS